MAKFLTSARAVDMLGRQQIAGIPTAVSEIFKNAYDAYADTVRGDYFPSRRILTIRDDGIGMSYADFTTRWLTIGTDSKARDSTRALPPVPAGVAPRKQMGEKGIGRLAIASVGSQLLLITKSRQSDELVVALLQWTFFEVPGLTLDDVSIPVRCITNVADLNLALIQDMAAEIRMAITALGSRISESRSRQISDDLDALSFNPRDFLSLNGPRIAETGGTAFIVAPVNEDFVSAISPEKKKSGEVLVSPFQRFLMGFANTITHNDNSASMTTEFMHHGSEGPIDLIDPSAFWRPEDFDLTDHTVTGEFDEYGTFSGRISVFGAEPVVVTEPWLANKGQLTKCGPFKLKFGYVQGEQSESRLSAEEFTLMTSRLQRLGGLYVYRDGIRVLPYGNSDTDYLEMEQRRSRNAGRYYFSYRRIFGAIEIDSTENPGLQEKAGREGFRENSAYRDFTNLLKDFLVQLAASFFSGKTEESDEFRRQRERLKGRSAARAEAELEEGRLRDDLSEVIQAKLHEFESGRFSDAVAKVVETATLQSKIVVASTATEAKELRAISAQSTLALDSILADFEVQKPSWLGLTAEQDRLFSSYNVARSRAVETIDEAARHLDVVLSAGKHDVGHQVERSARVRVVGQKQTQGLYEISKALAASLDEVSVDVLRAAKDEVAEFDLFLDDLLRELSVGVTVAKEVAALEKIRRESARRIANLDDLSRLLASIERGTSTLRDTAALQERVLDLQEQLDGNVELMQLGQAVQIVSHEFEASIKTVRAGLQKLAPWARSTPRLAPIVRDLRASFSHLDGYLRLFTPLQRRLYRQRVQITGSQVAEFVDGVFYDRFSRHKISLRVTENFRLWQFYGYPSTFYPVFVNLVDNALNWISEINTEDPMVCLDADEYSLYVIDNGPGVRMRDKDAIFERGFTRRRGGRGLGLALARDLLEREGWGLELDLRAAVGATFRIYPVTEIGRTQGS